jgi:hypothetical protein
MISLLHVNTLVVPLQVCLPDKLLIAIFQRAREWVLPACIMGLHMRLEIIAASEELTTTFDMALEIGIFFGSEFSNPCASWASPVI